MSLCANDTHCNGKNRSQNLSAFMDYRGDVLLEALCNGSIADVENWLREAQDAKAVQPEIAVVNRAYQHRRTDVLKWLISQDDLSVANSAKIWLIGLCDARLNWRMLTELQLWPSTTVNMRSFLDNDVARWRSLLRNAALKCSTEFLDYAWKFAPRVLQSDIAFLFFTSFDEGSGSLVDYLTSQCIDKLADSAGVFQKVLLELVRGQLNIQSINETCFYSILEDRADDLFCYWSEQPSRMHQLASLAMSADRPLLVAALLDRGYCPTGQSLVQLVSIAVSQARPRTLQIILDRLFEVDWINLFDSGFFKQCRQTWCGHSTPLIIVCLKLLNDAGAPKHYMFAKVAIENGLNDLFRYLLEQRYPVPQVAEDRVAVSK